MSQFSEELARELNKSPRQLEADEANYPWLSILLDTYHIFDSGSKLELEAEQKKRRTTIACTSGCCSCCMRPSAPLTEIEILGILWHVIHKQEDAVRAVVLDRMLNRKLSAECPFLLESRCCVYTARPLACRILHVFGAPCKPDEIPIETRSGDIWTPSRDVGSSAVMTMLTYFGFTSTQDKVKAFNEGFIPANSLPMGEVQWELLARASLGAGTRPAE